MEIRINLLPPELQARQQKRRSRRKLVLAGTLVLASFLIFNGILFLATLRINVEASRLRGERLALQAKAGELAQYARFQKTMQEYSQMIQSAVGQYPRWGNFMEEIAADIPLNARLTSLVTEPKSGNGANWWNVTLRGSAHNQRAVGAWLEDLRDLPRMSRVRCSYSMGKEPGEVEFEIQARYQTAGGQEKEKNAGKEDE